MTQVDLNQVLQAGKRCQQQGDLRQAELFYRQVLSAVPHHADALNALATLAIQVGQHEIASQLLRQAIMIEPRNVDYGMNLVSALRSLRQLDEALPLAKQAVAMVPDLPGPRTLLAAVLVDLLKPEEALIECQRAVEIDPEFFPAQHALSWIYGRLLRPRDVIAASDRALALDPNHAGVHWNKALAALAIGDFEPGWAEFEWRLQCFPHLRRDFSQPQWNRQDLSGSTILLHCEGGFGDALQFVRFVPEVIKRAGKVVLECPAELHALFASMTGAPTLFRRGNDLPPFDYHCPLQSLPYNLGTTIASIPVSIPVLRADVGKEDQFRAQMGKPAFGVGLVWAGSPLPTDTRSRTLTTFAPLSGVAGVQFFGLQAGPDASQAAHPPPGMELRDLSPHLHDFSDLAAAIANLDLVITVDTSVAHLAGAMGKPVWTLIPFVADFRWMLERNDTPWYPTMRLYRQTSRSDWNDSIARIVADLAQLRSTAS